jgi:dihydrofolate reductase
VARDVATLKDTVPGNILVAGSRQLVQTLLEHRLVDELRLMVFPIVLGTGARLFGETSQPLTMVLDSVQTVGAGVVTVVYRAAP